MSIGMFTLNRQDMGVFEGLLPESVKDNAGKPGYYVLGVADDDYTILGMAQFYIGMTPDRTITAEVCYIYVKEGSRGQGLATRMIDKVHRILKKSGVERSMVLLEKTGKETEFFRQNGYIFMKMDDASGEFLLKLHPDVEKVDVHQGIRWSTK